VVRRMVNWSFEGREVCRVTSLLVMLERSGSVRAGVRGSKIRVRYRFSRLFVCFTRAREYQIGLGLATDWPPPQS
jgi:hypothetical protein